MKNIHTCIDINEIVVYILARSNFWVFWRFCHETVDLHREFWSFNGGAGLPHTAAIFLDGILVEPFTPSQGTALASQLSDAP